jgi:predicted MPP superfamily phosphohydrolase
MKKALFAALFIVLSLILVFILRSFMPKYSGMMFFFFCFLLFNAYLWFSVHKGISVCNARLKVVIAGLFWMPILLVLCIMATSFFIPYLEWSIAVRTYLQSMILVLFVTVLLPILFLLLSDLYRLVRFMALLAMPGKSEALRAVPRYRPMLLTGWILGGLVFLTMMAGTVFWQFAFRVRTEAVKVKRLPVVFEGFKIVQFSDVHLGSWGCEAKLKEAVQLINSQHPDVIFFTGDMFNYYTADGNGFEGILQTLRAPFGVYAVKGNHDYGDYISWSSDRAKKQNNDDLVSFYSRLGWKLLLNSHDILRKGHDSIAVIGVENWGATGRFQRLGDVAVAQKGTETMAVQLLLSHDPSHWDSIVSKRFQNIDVTFAGHTHGGQLGIDACSIHWSPVSWTSKYWCGLYPNPDSSVSQYLYVNQALGNIGYAGRIGIMPEITVITLTGNREP